jgi:hypothetical protein
MEANMDTANSAVYVCPMHADIRQTQPGRCPTCGMNLVPEGARFKLLRHMLGSPMHIAIMGAVMVVIMAVVMMRWS